MSDQNTAATTQAPTPAVETVQTDAPVVQPTTPPTGAVNAAQRKQNIAQRINSASKTPAAPAVVDARGNVHDEAGKFAGRVASQEPIPETQAVIPSADTATTEAAPAPEVANRIEIPEGHPLRERGRRYLDELTQDEARGVLNSHIKRAEIEQATQRALEVEQRAMRAEREAQALREALSGAYRNPEVAARYNIILQEWGEAEAARYLRGIEAEVAEQVSAKQQEADQDFHVRQAEAQAAEFQTRVMDTLVRTNRYEAWPSHVLAQKVDNALWTYGSDLRRAQITSGQAQAPDLREFVEKYLDNEYRYSPEGRDHLSRAVSAREQARQEALRKQERELLEKEQRAVLEASVTAQRTNPMGRLPSVVTGQTIPVTTAARPVDARKRVESRVNGLR
jgi:hypothetical protein